MGEILNDRYRVSAVLGTGGMGAVYLATDEQLSGRRVAIKIPHDEFLLVPGFRGRFAREIRQLIDLEHPHIVTILDSGELDGRPFAVLQYLGGGSLGERLERLGRTMTVAEVMDWLPAVAESLDFIHRRGFLHRDIKPDNIFFDAEGHAFIADFGIALALGREELTRATQAGTVLGSPAYMAPEYGSGEAGPPYDQYALGVVVYHCLSGHVPHLPQATPIAYLARKMVDPPEPLGPLAPGIPRTVVSAVMRTLSARPEERFATCSAFASAVGAGASAAAGEGYPRPEAAGERRHPTAVYALAEERASLSSLAATEVLEPEDPPTPRRAAGEGRGVPTPVYDLAPERAPLAATKLIEPESLPTARPQPVLRSPRTSQYQPAPRSPRTSQYQPAPRGPWTSHPVPERLPTHWRLPAESRPSAPKATAAATILAVLTWTLAFAVGFVLLSDGSHVLFRLINPLASTDLSLRVQVWEDQLALAATTAAINLVLALVAGYTVTVISERRWIVNCASLAVMAVALTAWETSFPVPLVNTWALRLVSFDAAWMTMVAVPLGLLVGGYARSRQDRGRRLGVTFAALALPVVIALRLFSS